MADLLNQNLTDEEKKKLLWGTISSYGGYQPGGTPIQEQNIYTQPMEGKTIPNNYDPNQARVEALNSIAPKIQTPETMNRLTQYTANQMPPTPTTPDVWQGPNYYPGTVSSPEEQARNQAWADQLQIGRITKTVPTFNRGGHQTGSVERPDYAMRVAAQQRPEIAAIKSSSTANTNIKPYYQIDGKGNVLGNPTWLDEKDPNTINRVQNEGLVPPTDPRILANRQSLNVILGSDLLGKNELTKQVVDQLGPLKKEATSALNMSTQTDKALALINKGVTGKGGQFKAFVAPYAEALGYQGEELSDAQAFQLLTRAIIGPMRLDIVGPGPVSEWEQKLMQQISGGGGAAKPAAISLLSYWKTVAQGRIDNYNQTLEGMSTVHPVVNKVYKPIKSKEKEKSGVIRYDVTGKRIQ